MSIPAKKEKKKKPQPGSYLEASLVKDKIGTELSSIQ